MLYTALPLSTVRLGLALFFGLQTSPALYPVYEVVP